MTLLLGIIADDLTGGTDVASALARAGMRTLQVNGVPRSGLDGAEPADAIVVALKTRSQPPALAVEESLAALRFLLERQPRQIYFKYCSTFDSTPAGNIGPVADALCEALSADVTLFCPAFPDNRRTVKDAQLYVGEQLLADSPMRHHPLTPMTESNLVVVLGQQTRRRVGSIGLDVVKGGPTAIVEEVDRLRSAGVSYAVVDALSNLDLSLIGQACADLRLVTGASGLAGALPQNFRRSGLLQEHEAVGKSDLPAGLAAVLAGSCSEATRSQVDAWRRRNPSVHVEPQVGDTPLTLARRAFLAGQRALTQGEPVLYHSSAAPDSVRATQARLGAEAARLLIEDTFAELSKQLVAHGVNRLVVAGGETSGSVVAALGIDAVRIGPEIAAGVPWTFSLGQPRLALALKSGNFGGPELFSQALEMLK